MGKQLFAAAAIAALALAGDHLNDERTIMQHDMMENSLRNFDGIRGAWLGFNRGLYKHTSWKDMESKCLGTETRNHWIQAYSVWLGTDDLDDNIDMMTAAGDLVMIAANLNECNFRGPMRDIRKFCSTLQEVEDHLEGPSGSDDDDDEPELKAACSFGVVLENFTKNAFVLMGKGSTLADTWKEFPSENPDTLMVQALEMGEDMGTFVRVGIDFEPIKDE